LIVRIYGGIAAEDRAETSATEEGGHLQAHVLAGQAAAVADELDVAGCAIHVPAEMVPYGHIQRRSRPASKGTLEQPAHVVEIRIRNGGSQAEFIPQTLCQILADIKRAVGIRVIHGYQQH
jgi:hypothetical protein